MGLVKQIDDQIGCLLDFLEERGELDNTFIVFTSDHEDYLDFWSEDEVEGVSDRVSVGSDQVSVVY